MLALIAITGCSRQTEPAKPVDNYEKLIQHLLQRESDLSAQITQTENRCLQEENAMLRGEKVEHQLDLNPGLDRITANERDTETFIEEHNRRYPGLPWRRLDK